MVALPRIQYLLEKMSEKRSRFGKMSNAIAFIFSPSHPQRNTITDL
ncbi:hypothetical protein [Oscillatoria salina]|nr:hypothetical protein [Oscillatoria salina]MBZ8181471.1 hypothetical protein [Oscillatoria salina IIICB1]